MRTTVRLNEDLLRRLKAFAAERNRSMTSVLEDAVRQMLDLHENLPPKRHIDIITYGGDGYVTEIDLTPEAIKHIMMEEDIAKFKRVTDALS
jgi:plasmid stability protein